MDRADTKRVASSCGSKTEALASAGWECGSNAMYAIYAIYIYIYIYIYAIYAYMIIYIYIYICCDATLHHFRAKKNGYIIQKEGTFG